MKHKIERRIVTFFISMILSISFCVECLAVAPSYAVSESYKNGIYYQKLLSVNLTGNQIDDIINVAFSQLGYHEGKNTSDLSGDKTTSVTKKQKYNEYGYMHDNVNDDWCAYFVSWCARQARIPTSVIPKTGSCGVIRDSMKSRYYDVTSGYLPKKGDLILLEPSTGVAARDPKTGVPKTTGHVGIVTADCDGSTIHYIEGNNADVVMTNECEVYTKRGNERRVQGYLHPNYKGTSSGGGSADTSDQDDIISQIKVKAVKANSVTSNNATLYGTCEKPSSAVVIEDCGVYFGTSKDQLNTKIMEPVGTGANNKNSGTSFDIWYDVNEDLGKTLSPGTTYYYQFFCSYGDKEIKSDIASFTTQNAAKTTLQESLVYVYKGGKTQVYKTATGSEKTGTVDAADGQIMYHAYSYVDLANGTRRYECHTSDGSSRYIEFKASCMGVTYLPNEITTQEPHIYLNTEDCTRYYPTFIQTPANSKDSIEYLYDYDYDVVEVGRDQYGHYIEANGVGTTDVTYQGYYSGQKTTVRVTVVNGGAPRVSDFKQLENGEDGSYRFSMTAKDNEMARFGVKVWRQGEDEKEAETVWYTCDNFYGSYDTFSYNSAGNDGAYVLKSNLPRDTFAKSGGVYLITFLAQDIHGGVSAVTKAFDVEPSSEPLPFKDVSAGQYYYVPVMWALEENITSGLSTDVFGTGTACTREQIVTFIWNYAGKPEPTMTSCTFKDVNPNHYYYKAMLWANENGYVSGYNPETFGVGQPCTREQIVMILWKYTGSATTLRNTCDFKDVNSDHYYFNAMLWALENGITSGYTEDTFGVGQPCTREQIVTFLHRSDSVY